MRRFSLGFLAAMAMLIAVPSGAGAATTTIGQLAPVPEPRCDNPDPFDQVQASVTSGNSYVVPADGTITSWSHNASAEPQGQSMTFKIFRKLAGENEYQAIAHDGPRELTEGALNIFNVSIAVRAGDFIGLNDQDQEFACFFAVPGERGHRERNGDLADGESGVFVLSDEGRLNLSAILTTATCKGQQATQVGTAGNDLITGTDGPDVIAALGGNDEVRSLGANDLVCGGAGRDSLRGGKNKDTLLGQAGKDTLRGQRGKDKLLGKGGKDKLNGGTGKDVCKGGKKDDTAKKCEVEKSI